jgi:tetratricopeptide (TPR) repeat protein
MAKKTKAAPVKQKAHTQLFPRVPQIDVGLLLRQGLSLLQQGMLTQAQAKFDQVLSKQARNFDALHLSGIASAHSGHPDQALKWFDKAIRIDPYHAMAYYHRGLALRSLKRLTESLADFDRSLKLYPDHPEALNNRGVTLQELRKYDEAIASFDRAIQINPKYAEAYNNRGIALHQANRLVESLNSYDQAIALKPDYVESHSNQGVVLQDMHQLDEALAKYEMAAKINPEYAEAHWNQSLALLMKGDLANGWPLFEWRWKSEKTGLTMPSFSKPLWLGQEPLQDKTILLHAEQGLGDIIQFCRYAALVKGRGARVILEVPQALVSLLENLEGVDDLVTSGDSLPPFDFHCPLMSLPLAFKTDLDTIPNAGPYLFADPGKSQVWKDKLGIHRRLRVGLVWNGGFRPDQPEVWAVNARRNIPLEVFAGGLQLDHVDFYSLQKGEPAESEIKDNESKYWPRGHFTIWTDQINDFSDTAALIDNLDLVISVDTSTAHLAAAMGKPTWILNRYDTCWRWLLNRSDSPWYKSVKLYRQDESRSWAQVMQLVACDLKNFNPQLMPLQQF